MASAAGGSRSTRELGEIRCATDLLQLFSFLQLTRERNDVDRLTLCVEREHRVVDSTMLAGIKGVDAHEIRHFVHGVLVQHQGSKQRLLCFDVLRRHPRWFPDHACIVAQGLFPKFGASRHFCVFRVESVVDYWVD